MSKIPVSVCIIAKNEEAHIENCLRRIRPYGFEIVVADTGSTDATKAVAARYADRVIDYPWTDSFSAARNFCAAYASHKHILSLDCDEYMEACEPDRLLQLMHTHSNLTGVLQIRSIVNRPDGLTGYTKDLVPRFYDRTQFRYEKPVHEQLVRKAPVTISNVESGFLLPIDVIHHGYALSPDQMRIKQERNLRLLHRELAAEGESAYLCFQIGQSELVLGHCEEAIHFYEQGLACGIDCSLLYVHSLIEGLARAYVMADREKDALALMERYEPQCNSARYVFYHANVLMDNKEPLKALVKYVKATMMPDTDMFGDELLYCYRHIIELYHKFGEKELADVFVKKYEECQAKLSQ